MKRLMWAPDDASGALSYSFIESSKRCCPIRLAAAQLGGALFLAGLAVLCSLNCFATMCRRMQRGW